MASFVDTMGTIRRRVAVRASSWAMKFMGSLMATNTSSGVALTGTMLYFFAMFLGMVCVRSVGRMTFVRSIKSMPSCMHRTSMSSFSVM